MVSVVQWKKSQKDHLQKGYLQLLKGSYFPKRPKEKTKSDVTVEQLLAFR